MFGNGSPVKFLAALSCVGMLQSGLCMNQASRLRSLNSPLLGAFPEISETSPTHESYVSRYATLSPPSRLNLEPSDVGNLNTVNILKSKNHDDLELQVVMKHQLLNYKPRDKLFIKKPGIRHYISELNTVCQRATTLVRSRFFGPSPDTQPPEESSRILEFAKPKEGLIRSLLNYLPRRREETDAHVEVQVNEEETMDETITIKDILICVKNCLRALRLPNFYGASDPLSWYVRYETAIFEVMNYLVQHEVVSRNELKRFFSEDNTWRRLSHHISRLFPLGLDLGFTPDTGFWPDIDFLLRTWQTKHIHICLGVLTKVLEKSKKNELIHTAMTTSYKVSVKKKDWKISAPYLEKISLKLISGPLDSFVWDGAQNEDSMSPGFEADLTFLIEKFLGKTVAEENDSLNKHEYFLNFLILHYIIDNWDYKKPFSNMLLDEKELTRLKSGITLLDVCQELSMWMDYVRNVQNNENASTTIGVEKNKIIRVIKKIEGVYNNSKKEFEEDPYTVNPIVTKVVQEYFQAIDHYLQDFQ